MKPPSMPAFRRLRIYAFDPSLSLQLTTAAINTATVKVRWEPDPAADTAAEDTRLEPGPVGEYLEVIDIDPASERLYEPVDLNDPFLLAEDGLAPSEGNPKFHQQMVYAVAMLTIRNFEHALGRRALWSPLRPADSSGLWKKGKEEFVRRLRVYPHALRAQNAYYSPDKKALLFGYFPATPLSPGRHLPGGMVFTCLSHDIIAHETSHALLDGLHERFRENSNPDVLAFHEAFADIVSIFQHFSLPDVVRHQIVSTRGDLRKKNYLGELATQFGIATGKRDALRSAINRIDPTTGLPDPTEYARTTLVHDRGSILVAAVFDAFTAIYEHRVAPLRRLAYAQIADPNAPMPQDLVDLLSAEASKTASHVLTMCIRALDYCPPVDITFGEYLRAIITADYDLVPDDDLNYRVALIEAFRLRGIYPRDVRTMSVESLLWGSPQNEKLIRDLFGPIEEMVKEMPSWDMREDRETVFKGLKHFRGWMKDLLRRRQASGKFTAHFAEIGLDAGLNRDGAVEVHSVRPVRRIGPDGQVLTDLIIVLTQGRPVLFNRNREDFHQPKCPNTWKPDKAIAAADFWYRGGCTLIMDWQTGKPRYCVYKRLGINQRRFILQTGHEWQRRHGDTGTYFTNAVAFGLDEPFALLHNDGDSRPVSTESDIDA